MNNPDNPVMQQIVSSVVDTPQTPDKQEAAREITEAIGTSKDVLVSATTVFPFTLFPDTLTLDRTELRLTKRDIFKSGEVFSIRVEDILSITASVDLFFGTITIVTRFFDAGKKHIVKFLTRGDALKVKRIVQGYLVAKQQDIDCSALSTEELAKMFDELGQVAPADKV